MIVWILLIALIVTAITILLGIVFGYTRNRNFRKGVRIGVAICVGLITFCLVLGGQYSNRVDALKAQYEDIMLYHDVVNNCDNEEVRFGHYEKICAFNDKYDEMTKIAENNLFGTLVSKNWSDGLSPITFVLRGTY